MFEMCYVCVSHLNVINNFDTMYLLDLIDLYINQKLCKCRCELWFKSLIEVKNNKRYEGIKFGNKTFTILFENTHVSTAFEYL